LENRKEKIKEIDRLLKKRYGIPPRPEKLPDPVEMLIATILSQNTNDNNSFKAYNNLKEKFIRFEDIAATRQSVLEKTISVAGLTQQKASAIKNAVKSILEDQGKLSLENLNHLTESGAIDYLTRLKGVGVKTASCVLLFAMDKNVCPVDTHVHRITNRTGLVKAASPDKTYYQLNEDFPAKIAHSFHTNLIKLGREICKPSKPACAICPIEKMCEFKEKDFEQNRKTVRREFMLLDNVKSGKG